MPFQKGDTIDSYTLESQLGGGGFAEVWRVKDRFNQIWAMKIFTAQTGMDSYGRSMFRDEFEKTRNLRHNNVLSCVEFGEHEGKPYLIMPLGKSSLMIELRNRLLQRKQSGNPEALLFTEVELAQIIADLADGLGYLQQCGIIHQDIKPDNVLLIEEHGISRYAIADFGVSTQLRTSIMRQTQALHKGSENVAAGYASPEQLDGHITKKSDIFSLGVMLYELTTGRLPFEEAGLPTGRAIHDGLTPPPVPGEYTGRFKKLIALCLEKDPQRRPDAAQILNWADGFLRQSFWSDGVEKVGKRNFLKDWRVLAGAGLLVLLIAGFFVGKALKKTDNPTPGPAPTPTAVSGFAINGNSTDSEMRVPPGTTLTFQAAGGGEKTVFTWDFGDGATTTGRDASHSFLKTGSYTIKVCSDAPANCVEKKIVVEKNAPPPKPAPKVDVVGKNDPTPQPNPVPPVDVTTTVGGPTILGPQIVFDGQKPEFTGKSNNPSDGSNYELVWNFGDGTAPVTTVEKKTGHRFPKPGKYTISLTINGRTSTAPIEVESEPVPIPCRQTGKTGLPSSERCKKEISEKQWSDNATMTLTPKKDLRLVNCVVHGNGNGNVELSLSFIDKHGISRTVSTSAPITSGPNQIGLDDGDLAINLHAGTTYTLNVRTRGKNTKIENAANCNPSPPSDPNLKIDYKGSFVIFDVSYCH